jgi:tetratricopeptide (TPR) repeat protein
MAAALLIMAPARCADNHNLAEQAIARGRALEKNSPTQAFKCYQFANKLEPQNWQPYYYMAMNLISFDDPPAAAKLAEQGIAVDSKQGELWFARAQAYAVMHVNDKADESYSRAIALKPDYSYYLRKRGNFEFSTNRRAQAVKDYSRAIELCKKEERHTGERRQEAGAAAADAYNDRGDVYLALGKWQAAADDYTQALSVKYSDLARGRTLTNRAQCYDKLGKHTLAEADRKSVNASSTDVLKDLMR